MSDTFSVELETVHNDMVGVIAYFARGHVDKAEFLEAVKAEEPDDEIELDNIYQEHWRCVKAGEDDVGVEDNKFIVSEPGKGAFAVTVWDVEPWDKS